MTFLRIIRYPGTMKPHMLGHLLPTIFHVGFNVSFPLTMPILFVFDLVSMEVIFIWFLDYAIEIVYDDGVHFLYCTAFLGFVQVILVTVMKKFWVLLLILITELLLCWQLMVFLDSRHVCNSRNLLICYSSKLILLSLAFLVRSAATKINSHMFGRMFFMLRGKSKL